MLAGLGPERGRARFEPFRMLEQGQDLLVPELQAFGLPAAAERSPALCRACPLPSDERQATGRRRARS